MTGHTPQAAVRKPAWEARPDGAGADLGSTPVETLVAPPQSSFAAAKEYAPRCALRPRVTRRRIPWRFVIPSAFAASLILASYAGLRYLRPARTTANALAFFGLRRQ